jgi:hypothetical protein
MDVVPPREDFADDLLELQIGTVPFALKRAKGQLVACCAFFLAAVILQVLRQLKIARPYRARDAVILLMRTKLICPTGYFADRLSSLGCKNISLLV